MIVRDDLKAKRAAVSAISTRSLNGPIEGSTMAISKTMNHQLGDTSEYNLKTLWSKIQVLGAAYTIA